MINAAPDPSSQGQSVGLPVLASTGDALAEATVAVDPEFVPLAVDPELLVAEAGVVLWSIRKGAENRWGFWKSF